MKVLSIEEKVEGYPALTKLKIEGRNKPIVVFKNWFGARQELGLPPLKISDEVDFEPGIERYNGDFDFDFVQKFHIVGEGEVV